MTVDSLSDRSTSANTMAGLRPALMGTRHGISAGHYLAAHAGFEILEAGGNAVDAGVAACMVMAVVQSEMVNVAGVAPMLVYLADAGSVQAIAGLGHWPRRASAEFFLRECGGEIPEGILRTVVPAAPAAWLTALRDFGTMRFADVACAAIRFARDGFPMYPLMAELLDASADKYARWPSSASVYLPNGRAPRVGELFVQADLARTLQYMVDEERRCSAGDRRSSLAAAYDAFYRGDIAAKICRYHVENGGLLAMEDMADLAISPEPALSLDFHGTRVFGCDAWCQGPMLMQSLRLIDDVDLSAIGHNSMAYIHLLTECLKLSFADRHRYYGDPRFVDVPVAALLSPEYARLRRQLVRPDRAWPGLMPPGDPVGGLAQISPAATSLPGWQQPALSLDTSYVAVIDRHGNAFSATPSDVSGDTPVIPGTGLCPSSRGSQSWLDAGHPSRVAPGKRPRLTPNPALAIRPGSYVMPFGTPGGDVQCQAMLQAFLNLEVFGMNPQEAVEEPRFATYSFPDSFWPHSSFPDRLNLEARIPQQTGADLSKLGHDVTWWPEWVWRAGAVCLVRADLSTGVLSAGADPRRPCYALCW